MKFITLYVTISIWSMALLLGIAIYTHPYVYLTIAIVILTTPFIILERYSLIERIPDAMAMTEVLYSTIMILLIFAITLTFPVRHFCACPSWNLTVHILGIPLLLLALSRLCMQLFVEIDNPLLAVLAYPFAKLYEYLENKEE